MRALEPDDPVAAGPYRLLGRIATGGTATVYFGRSASGRAVAVKVPHPGTPRPRIIREIEATRAAAGGYSPALLDADPDAPWLAMEYLPGISVRHAVRLAGPLPPPVVAALTAGAAEALRAVHAAGLLHLDVSPANVLLTPDGPRLIDFGVAVRADDPEPGLVGAPGFIAPEVLGGRAAGPAADVYGLGATLVYAATGAPPDGSVADDLLRRCLDPDPGRRPTAAGVLAAATRRPGSRSGPASFSGPASATGSGGGSGGLSAGGLVVAAPWLPPAVAAAIQERIDPVPPPQPIVPAGPAKPRPRRFRAGTRAADLSPVSPGPGAAGMSPPRPGPGAAGVSPVSPGPGAGSGLRRSRRGLVAGVLAAAVAGGIVVAVLAPGADDDPPALSGTAPGPSPSIPATVSGSPSATGRTFRFYCTGNGRIDRMTWRAGDRSGTADAPLLPWSQDVRIGPGATAWELRYTKPDGIMSCQMSIDGKAVFRGSDTGTPGPDRPVSTYSGTN